MDLSGIMNKFNEPRGGTANVSGDIVMLKNGILVAANMGKSKINALACENDESLPIIALKCKDTFHELSKVAEKPEIMGMCPDPKKCQMEFESGEHTFRPQVIGNENGYHPDSVICTAAKHANIVTKTLAGNMVTISKVGETNKFIGTSKNGVVSKNLNEEIPKNK